MPSEKRLGRGLESLMGPQSSEPRAAGPNRAAEARSGPRELAVESIVPNPHQPRKVFDVSALEELTSSIRDKGVLQPILVRDVGTGFELIAGERRWRAARAAGLLSIPAVVLEASDPEMIEIALIENIQREDLNPIDRARSCQELIRTRGCTHEEIARRLGKDRATITNLIRLLSLPEPVREMVSRGTISNGHARALLSLQNASRQEEVARRICEDGLSVREAERVCSAECTSNRPLRPESKGGSLEPWARDLESQLARALSAKVTLALHGKRGSVTIRFADLGGLDRIVKRLGI